MSPQEWFYESPGFPELQSQVVASITAYADNGWRYEWKQFEDYYGEGRGLQHWRIGEKVTAGTFMILRQLAQQESQLMSRSAEYRHFQDALLLVTWWVRQRSSPTPDPEFQGPSNGEVFANLADSVALPLWYREQLTATEDISTVLDQDRSEAAWQAWRADFCYKRLRSDQQQLVPQKKRSIFEAHVRNSVGHPMLAKLIISHGPTRVCQILVLFAEHKRSLSHLLTVQQTHWASHDVRAVRRQYRVSRNI